MATIPGYVQEDRGETPFPDRRSRKVDRLSPVAALVRRHDRDRFQTVLFAPAARREALFALYAFNCEIARVRERVTQPTLGRIRLEWWRESIAAAFEGGPVRHHPVVESLNAVILEHGLTREHFRQLIDARESDLDEQPPASLAALEDYAAASSARLVYLALEVLGVRDPTTRQAGHHVGIAYALAGLLRALPYGGRIGRHLAPAEIAAAASRHLDLARSPHEKLPRAALPALLPAIVAERSLKRLKRAEFNPFDQTLAAPDPLQSWRLAAAALFNRF
jgi:NADH dehydrogenase [ubiquinone] 1 alpha subcomplex assembly factor 6